MQEFGGARVSIICPLLDENEKTIILKDNKLERLVGYGWTGITSNGHFTEMHKKQLRFSVRCNL